MNYSWGKQAFDDLDYRYRQFEAHLEFGAGIVIKKHFGFSIGYDMGLTNRVKGEASKTVAERWRSYNAGIQYRF